MQTDVRAYRERFIKSDTKLQHDAKAITAAVDAIVHDKGTYGKILNTTAAKASNTNFVESKTGKTGKETDRRQDLKHPVSKKDISSFLQTDHRIPRGCPDIQDKNLFILTFVVSSPYNAHRRRAIRNSWARSTVVDGKMVLTIFVMGKHPKSWDDVAMYSLDHEIAQHRDILRGSFKVDHEIRTSLKVLLGLQFVRDHCHRVSYVLVVTDVMFVNYKRLVKVLSSGKYQDKRDAKVWMGSVQKGIRPIRDSTNPHYISEQQFSQSVFPPFCSIDAGFVMTLSAAKDLYKSAQSKTLFPFFDLYASVIARDQNWTVVDSNDIFTTRRMSSKVCWMDRIVTAVAPENPNSSKTIWNDLNNVISLRKCMVDPDMDLVLPDDVNNTRLLRRVLETAVDHPHVCFSSHRRPQDVFILVLISSRPENSDMRNAIRKTWGSEQVVDGKQLKLIFLLGRQARETSETRTRVKREDALHNDIVQADFLDCPQNNTLKVILGLQWANFHCPHAKFVYRGDDDMFVNFVNLIQYLKNTSKTAGEHFRLYLGSKMYGKANPSPMRKNQSNLKESSASDKLYLGKYFPPYCSGSGYVLSGSVVPAMYREALRTPVISVPDAYQGILSKRIGLEPTGHRGFKTWAGKVDACSLRAVDTMTVHGIGKTAQQLLDVWHAFKDNSIKCKNMRAHS
ncbi:N-acetyllactosaminide beta-1,3-N-acetylglucosaminyltransferase 2-like [Diadema setosum]|uniref:N-acetyllactosaminide beta-1,3-N-acetylglucosaminyltransferase 2-like n=1 Tax=Diadema setosum TaxID=31175 RepID=UPI003B3AAB58